MSKNELHNRLDNITDVWTKEFIKTLECIRFRDNQTHYLNYVCFEIHYVLKHIENTVEPHNHPQPNVMQRSHLEIARVPLRNIQNNFDILIYNIINVYNEKDWGVNIYYICTYVNFKLFNPFIKYSNKNLL